VNLYLNETLVTAEELKQRLFDEIDPLDVIELVMVDEEGSLWFEVNRYGIYY
jgi:hypothetical protein